jgi:hypothetical protein
MRASWCAEWFAKKRAAAWPLFVFRESYYRCGGELRDGADDRDPPPLDGMRIEG